jgi:hypothetical protein
MKAPSIATRIAIFMPRAYGLCRRAFASGAGGGCSGRRRGRASAFCKSREGLLATDVLLSEGLSLWRRR